MQHIIENHPDMATALLAGEKLKELILPGQQDERAGALAALLLQLKLELPFDRVVTIGTVLVPILLVTLVFTKNFAAVTRQQTGSRERKLEKIFFSRERRGSRAFFSFSFEREPPDKTSNSKLHIRVNCKLPSVQLQRIIAGVDIVLLCFMNLIILINLIHLFIFRKSNFIFDKLNKVGIKTKKQWQKSQFCDINILAMFCNENRDHIKSLNRLDFITNESDLMYDNVVRQLLAALAQSNHDATPTMRDSGIQTIDPSIDPADIDANEQLIIKRPRKKMKWIPSSNPLPQPFKEQLAIMKVENHKPEKPKPVRRKTATDSLIAPLLESTAKSSQQSSSQKTEPNTISGANNEKKHTRHFSLDVHPYILSSKKPKPEIQAIASMPTSNSQEGGFLNQEENVIVHVTSSLKDPHPEKDALYSSETCRTVPAAGVFLTCNHKHIATSAAATNVTLSQAKSEPTPALNCNAAHPLLHINTLYEDHEEEVSNLIDNGIHSPTEPREILSIPTPKQRMIATFDEPMAIVSSVEY
ncbi:pannexin-2 [Alligator mississippiensis]|uniref:Pannexin-2 n=1 Tax=Alligator mississippiensis TaxID=8496 RepID=A0A151PEF4_ALLMI|nr:pannexin-2 [Alligator mississippiensis]